MLTNRCGCCGSCEFCTESEVAPTVQGDFTLANADCLVAGTSCLDIDGPFVFDDRPVATVPANANTRTGTTADGTACHWTYTSATTVCQTNDCNALTCSLVCTDDGNSCDPGDPTTCEDEASCTPGLTGEAACEDVLACVASAGSPEPDACLCEETAPGSGIYQCNCDTTACSAGFLCSASAVINLYLYSADSDTKRVLYVEITLENEEFYGYQTFATDTLDCRTEINALVITLTAVDPTPTDPKLCVPPADITITFV